MRRRLLVLLAGLTLVSTACSGGTSVGDDVVTGAGGGERGAIDGATTTTAGAPETATASDSGEGSSGGSPESTIAQPPPSIVPTTTAPSATTTTTGANPSAYEITINADSGDQPQFDPSIARVFEGTTVRWVNRDSVPRSVVFNDGSFESPEIAPGASAEYRATRAGRFDYSDGTRPYAVGTLEVVAR